MLTQTFVIALMQLKAFLQENSTGRPFSQEYWNVLDASRQKGVRRHYFYLFETGSKSFRQSPRYVPCWSNPRLSPRHFTCRLSSRTDWGEIRNAGPNAAPDSETSDFESMAFLALGDRHMEDCVLLNIRMSGSDGWRSKNECPRKDLAPVIPNR